MASFGPVAVDALFNLQQRFSGPIHIGTFRNLSAVLDWHLFSPIVEYLSGTRPNPGGLNAIIFKVAKEQWYTWHVMHPDLNVHETRRVLN